MKLFVKILLLVFVAFVANVKVTSATIIFSTIQEVTTSFLFQNEEPKTKFEFSENDLANSCKNELDLVDYRNWGTGVEAVAANVNETPWIVAVCNCDTIIFEFIIHINYIL